MTEERCLICGAIIPEGRQVCPNCENVSRKPFWASLDDDTPRGWRFYCSECGGAVYWPQPTRGPKRKERCCGYPHCPYCLTKMEGNRK